MSGRPGVLLVRQGQYALALLEDTSCDVPGCRLEHPMRIEVEGDCIERAAQWIVLDMLLLAAGVNPPGIMCMSVVEP